MPGCSSASTPKKVHHALGEERSRRRAPSLHGFTRPASARSRVARHVTGTVLHRGLHDANTRLARARARQPSSENGANVFCPGRKLRRFFEQVLPLPTAVRSLLPGTSERRDRLGDTVRASRAVAQRSFGAARRRAGGLTPFSRASGAHVPPNGSCVVNPRAPCPSPPAFEEI
jgi:hypothetical protein